MSRFPSDMVSELQWWHPPRSLQGWVLPWDLRSYQLLEPQVRFCLLRDSASPYTPPPPPHPPSPPPLPHTFQGWTICYTFCGTVHGACSIRIAAQCSADSHSMLLVGCLGSNCWRRALPFNATVASSSQPHRSHVAYNPHKGSSIWLYLSRPPAHHQTEFCVNGEDMLRRADCALEECGLSCTP